MAQARRSDAEPAAPAEWPAARDHRYDPGGPVARLHAQLARQVVDAPLAEPPGERIVRFVSVAGGYLALLAGYAAAAALILR